MCSIEETLYREGKMPTYYRRYVDDTSTIMRDKTSADKFLETLSHCHSSGKFTMERENNGMLPFLGTQLLNKLTHIETKVYIKPTIQTLTFYYAARVMLTIAGYKRAAFQRLRLIVLFDFLLTGPISLRNVIASNYCFLD